MRVGDGGLLTNNDKYEQIGHTDSSEVSITYLYDKSCGLCNNLIYRLPKAGSLSSRAFEEALPCSLRTSAPDQPGHNKQQAMRSGSSGDVKSVTPRCAHLPHPIPRCW